MGERFRARATFIFYSLRYAACTLPSQKLHPAEERPMSTVSTLHSLELHLRKMTMADLVQVHEADPLWLRSLHPGQDLRLGLESGDSTGHVAESHGCLAG